MDISAAYIFITFNTSFYKQSSPSVIWEGGGGGLPGNPDHRGENSVVRKTLKTGH